MSHPLNKQHHTLGVVNNDDGDDGKSKKPTLTSKKSKRMVFNREHISKLKGMSFTNSALFSNNNNSPNTSSSSSSSSSNSGNNTKTPKKESNEPQSARKLSTSTAKLLPKGLRSKYQNSEQQVKEELEEDNHHSYHQTTNGDNNSNSSTRPTRIPPKPPSSSTPNLVKNPTKSASCCSSSSSSCNTKNRQRRRCGVLCRLCKCTFSVFYWIYAHPFLRISFTICALLLNTLMFAEDPQSYSNVPVTIPFFGVMYNFLFSGYPDMDVYRSWFIFKILLLVMVPIIGILIGEFIFRQLLLKKIFGLKGFKRLKGILPMVFISSMVSIWIAAFIYSYFLNYRIIGKDWKIISWLMRGVYIEDKDVINRDLEECLPSNQLPLSNSYFSLLAFYFTVIGDCYTIFSVTDVILQSKKSYKGWCCCCFRVGKKYWNYIRIPLFWMYMGLCIFSLCYVHALQMTTSDSYWEGVTYSKYNHSQDPGIEREEKVLTEICRDNLCKLEHFLKSSHWFSDYILEFYTGGQITDLGSSYPNETLYHLHYPHLTNNLNPDLRYGGGDIYPLKYFQNYTNSSHYPNLQYLPNRGFFNWNETDRVALACIILVLNLIILSQDSEYPHFEPKKDYKPTSVLERMVLTGDENNDDIGNDDDDDDDDDDDKVDETFKIPGLNTDHISLPNLFCMKRCNYRAKKCFTTRYCVVKYASLSCKRTKKRWLPSFKTRSYIFHNVLCYLWSFLSFGRNNNGKRNKNDGSVFWDSTDSDNETNIGDVEEDGEFTEDYLYSANTESVELSSSSSSSSSLDYDNQDKPKLKQIQLKKEHYYTLARLCTCCHEKHQLVKKQQNNNDGDDDGDGTYKSKKTTLPRVSVLYDFDSTANINNFRDEDDFLYLRDRKRKLFKDRQVITARWLVYCIIFSVTILDVLCLYSQLTYTLNINGQVIDNNGQVHTIITNHQDLRENDDDNDHLSTLSSSFNNNSNSTTTTTTTTTNTFRYHNLAILCPQQYDNVCDFGDKHSSIIWNWLDDTADCITYYPSLVATNVSIDDFQSNMREIIIKSDNSDFLDSLDLIYLPQPTRKGSTLYATKCLCYLKHSLETSTLISSPLTTTEIVSTYEGKLSQCDYDYDYDEKEVLDSTQFYIINENQQDFSLDTFTDGCSKVATYEIKLNEMDDLFINNITSDNSNNNNNIQWAIKKRVHFNWDEEEDYNTDVRCLSCKQYYTRNTFSDSYFISDTIRNGDQITIIFDICNHTGRTSAVLTEREFTCVVTSGPLKIRYFRHSFLSKEITITLLSVIFMLTILIRIIVGFIYRSLLKWNIKYATELASLLRDEQQQQQQQQHDKKHDDKDGNEVISAAKVDYNPFKYNVSKKKYAKCKLVLIDWCLYLRCKQKKRVNGRLCGSCTVGNYKCCLWCDGDENTNSFQYEI